MGKSNGAGLDRAVLERRYDEIRRTYRADDRPWVVGYSGGKDSTTTLQLIWTALSSLPAEERTKPVYVIAADTLVETPKIVEYIDANLDKMNRAARKGSLPFSAHKVKPRTEDSFWVNLIGKGYPAPSKTFRWCTERLKIHPANQFINDRVTEHGEVVVVLGVRKSESATRAQVMTLHRIKGSVLSRHSSLANAFVYTPIEDFSVDDVWTYLLQVPSPWGNNNRDLVTLYRNAQAGECPLVVDTTTPSCGNSRFGCWVCTVVTKDKSMEALIDSGEEWMQPLLDYRDMLAETQDPDAKAQLRQFKRRNGRVMTDKTGTPRRWGPYTLETRKELLRRLLATQLLVRRDGPDSEEELITFAELEHIRRIWRAEEHDWEDSVARIVHEVTGAVHSWERDEQPGFAREDLSLLEKFCERENIPVGLVAKLLEVERQVHGMTRRASVHQRIASVLEEDWRTDDEIVRTARVTPSAEPSLS